MNGEFVNYDIAVQLKNAGFDEPCMMCYYGENKYGMPKDKLYLPASFGKVRNSIPEGDILDESTVTAPTWQAAIAWLRTVQGLHIKIDYYGERYRAHINIMHPKTKVRGYSIWDDDHDIARTKIINRALKHLRDEPWNE